MSSIKEFFIVPPEDWLFPNNNDVIFAKMRAAEYWQKNSTYVGVELEIEEFVRQWVLLELINTYTYPKEWIGERIRIEHPVKIGSTTYSSDIALINDVNHPFIFIETKKRGISKSEFQEAEEQLQSYLAATHTATIGLTTDGVSVRCIRKKIDPNDFEYIPDIPSNNSSTQIQEKLVRSIIGNTSNRYTGLQLLSAQYERLLFNCHNTIRDIDGLHADEALDEICKILYTKIYDERNTIKKPIGTAFSFQTYGYTNSSEVASTIRSLYEEARNADIEIYSQRIPGYSRSRGVFKTQIRLSDIALFKVVEILQDFSLIDSSADLKGRAFQAVIAPAIRSGMGQYFTPDPIVELTIGVIKPTAKDLILDPFCGSGHFLTKALQYVVNTQGQHLDSHSLNEFKFFHLHGIEKSDRMVRVAMTDMMLHDDGHTNIRNQDALLSFDNYPDITALRDDHNADPAIFSIILTNPPFGSLIRQEAMNMLGRFSLGIGRKSLPLEFLGLERAIQFLAPGGRMAIVLPEHMTKGKTGKFVRDWLINVAHIKAIFFFPEEAFTPYGAMVKTCLLILQKFKSGEKPLPEDMTFLCEVENLGYDATGKLKHGAEIEQAIMAFHSQVSWS